MQQYLRRFFAVIVLFVLFGAIGIFLTQEGGRIPLTPEQLSVTAGVSDFTWSPDGRSIAFVSTASGESDIWLVPANGGSVRRLTNSPDAKSEPRWSPQGDWIAFVSEQATGEANLRAVSSSGDSTLDLTDSLADDRSPRWSPDGTGIAFRRHEGPRAGLMHVNFGTRSIRKIIDGPTTGHEWSPNGKWIAYVANPLPNDNRLDNSDLYVVAADGGTPRLLTPGTQRYHDQSPTWSADSARIAFQSEATGFNNIYTIDVNGGERRSFATGNADNISPKWSPDGTQIAWVRNEDHRFHVYVAPNQPNQSARRLSDRDGVNGGFETTDGSPRGRIEWSPDGKRLAFVHSDAGRAPDIWVATVDPAHPVSPTQITNSMPVSLRRESRFVFPEALTYKSFDGEEIRALLYKPRSARPAAGYPAVLVFRDSIGGQLANGWNPFIQLLASNGILVFAPNVRGSSGRGRDHRQMAFQHGGDYDVRDAFLGLDRLAADGTIATERVGVLGAGIGGFLAGAALVRDETRFRAAAIIDGVVDASSAFFYSGKESEWRFLTGGTPLLNPRAYYDRSLVHFVDRLRAPIMFFYSANNALASSQQLAAFAVQAEVQGKWFDYHVFEGETAWTPAWKPASLKATLESLSALFDKYLLGRDRDIRLTRRTQ